MKRELRKYLLGIPSLSAWERHDILEFVDKTYKMKKDIIIFKTAMFTIAMFAIFSFIIALITMKNHG